MNPMILIAVQASSKDVPDIIRAAAEKPLGILALIILVVAALAYVFFRKQGPRVTLPVFGAVLLAAILYGVAITGESSRKISGTVSDVAGGNPVENATVHLNWGQYTGQQTTDSEGFYQFSIEGASVPDTVSLVVEAEGYARYTRTLTNPLLHMQNIRLHKAKANSDFEQVKPIDNTAENPKLEPAPCNAGIELKSVNSGIRATLRFNNRSPSTIEIYWIDYNGKEQFWSELPANSAFDEDTYVGHSWVVRSIKGKCLAVFTPTAQSSVADIPHTSN